MKLFSWQRIIVVLLIGLFFSTDAYCEQVDQRHKKDTWRKTDLSSADIPTHYILLLDRSGSMNDYSNYARDLKNIISEHIPELITNPKKHGIHLESYRPGTDYLSFMLFGIHAHKAHFSKLFYPIATFWRDEQQFKKMGRKIDEILRDKSVFGTHYTALSAAVPLSLSAVKKSLSDLEVVAEFFSEKPRFRRTVGIVVTDGEYNYDENYRSELFSLGRIIEGSDEALDIIKTVRNFYDYDSNEWEFKDQGTSGKFKIIVLEFVPKFDVISHFKKPSNATIYRYAPSPKQLLYIGEISLNFINSNDPLSECYSPRELRWKLGTETQFSARDLDSEGLKDFYLTLPIEFEKRISDDPFKDSQKKYHLDLTATYDLNDPVYGLQSLVLEDQVELSPEIPAVLPFPKWPIKDKWLLSCAHIPWLIPVTVQEVQNTYFWLIIISTIIVVVLVLFYALMPPLQVGIRELQSDPTPIIVDFNSRSGEHKFAIKTLSAENIAGKRWFIIPPLWSRRFRLRLEGSNRDCGESSGIQLDHDLIGITSTIKDQVDIQCTDGQEITIFCDPSAIKDFRGSGVEAKLTYRMEVYRLSRFRKNPISIETLEIPVEITFVREKTSSKVELDLLPQAQEGGIEHRKGEQLLIGHAVIYSTAQYYCSDPVTCAYALLSSLEGTRPDEKNEYVIPDSVQDLQRASYSRAWEGVKTRFQISDMPYKEKVKVPILVDCDSVKNPTIGVVSYGFSICRLDMEGILTSGDELRGKFLIKKDSRLSDLEFTTVIMGQEGSFAHPIEDMSYQLEYPVMWNKVQPNAFEVLLKVIFENTAKSGGGKVVVNIGDIDLKLENPDVIELKNQSDMGALLKWQRVRHSSIDDDFDHSPISVFDVIDEQAPVQLELGVVPTTIQQMNRAQVSFKIMVPIQYSIQPDSGVNREGVFNLSLDFKLERDLGPEFLAIDFGTSAVAIAFEGDTNNLLLRDQEGNPARYSLLDLQSTFVQQAQARSPNSDLTNSEEGTRFIPSLGAIQTKSPSNGRETEIRCGEPDFFQIPACKDDIHRNPHLAVPFLKTLISEGVKNIPLARDTSYFDVNGKQRTGKPPLKETLISSYRALRKYYIEPYLKENKYLDHFDKLIVAHPNTFTLSHLELLENVLRQAFPAQDRIILLSESDASAMYYLFREGEFRKELTGSEEIPEKEHILVFDIGAGTLDMTYLEVEREPSVKTPKRVVYKAKMGIPVAGNSLDTSIARFVDRKLTQIESYAKSKKIKFTYTDRIVPMTNRPIGKRTRTHMFDLWDGILDWKKEYAQSPDSQKIPLRLGRVNETVIDISNYVEDKSFYEANGLSLQLIEGINYWFLELSIKEIMDDKSVKEWEEIVSQWSVEEFFKTISPKSRKVPLDVVILSGRTMLWPNLRERVLETIGNFTERQDELFIPKIEDKDMKVTVVIGSLVYAILWKGDVQFEDRNIWGRYGILYNKEPQHREFVDLFEYPIDKGSKKKKGKYGQTIYMPKGEVTINIANSPDIQIVASFVSDPASLIQETRLHSHYRQVAFVPIYRPISRRSLGKGVKEVTLKAEVDDRNVLSVRYITDKGKQIDLQKGYDRKPPLRAWPIDPVVLSPEEG